MEVNLLFVITFAFALTIVIASGFSTSLQSETKSPTELQISSADHDHLREKLFKLMDEENPSLSEIENLIGQGVDIINSVNEEGLTPLLYTARKSNETGNVIDVLQFLLGHGANVTSKDEKGWTALHFVSRYYKKGNLIEIMKLLIENGIEVNGKTNDGLTVLHLVCVSYQHENLIEIIRLLIQNGINTNAKHINNGWAALHLVCRHYQKGNLVDIIRLLIGNGVDIKGKTNEGWTALHIVCRYYKNQNLIDIIRLLVGNGVDINGKTNDGWTALHQVCRFDQNDNLIEIIRLLIQNGIDVNGKTNDGWTALNIVSANYQKDDLIEIIRLFIENKVDVNANINAGFNTLHLVCQHYRKENLIEIIRLLIGNGVDVKAKTNDGATALHIVCRNYQKDNLIDIIRLFIETGFDIKGTTNDGSTALHELCRFYEKQNIIEIIKLLTTDESTDLQLVCQNYRNETEFDRKTEIRDTTTIAASVVLPIFFLVSLVVGIYLFKKQQTLAAAEKYLKGNLKSANRDLLVVEQTERLPYDERWEFPRDRLILGKQLGAGCFGVVVKAKAVGLKGSGEISKTVAVKMPKAQTNAAALQDLISELKVLIYLGSHLNILNLLGACTKRLHKGELLIIVEYCQFGNLQSYLLNNRKHFINQVDEMGNLKVESTITQEERANNSKLAIQQHETDAMTISGVPKDSDGYMVPFSAGEDLSQGESTSETDKSKTISTKDLVSWSFQIARGMNYLSTKKVLHGDLAARNVLLTDNGVVKVSDFGMARKLYSEINYKKMDQGLIPIKWMALESLTHRILSIESDVWSYGILLWELFSLGKVPYPGIENKQLVQELENGYRMEKPNYAPNFIGEIMTDCWKKEPKERPSFSQIEGIVSSNIESSVSSFYSNLNAPYEKFNQDKTDAPKTECFGLAKLLIDKSKIAKSLSQPVDLEGRYSQSPRNLQFTLHGEEISC